MAGKTKESERGVDKSAASRTAAGERRERLAAELRANLKKRKARARSVSRDADGDIKKPL